MLSGREAHFPLSTGSSSSKLSQRNASSVIFTPHKPKLWHDSNKRNVIIGIRIFPHIFTVQNLYCHHNVLTVLRILYNETSNGSIHLTESKGNKIIAPGRNHPYAAWLSSCQSQFSSNNSEVRWSLYVRAATSGGNTLLVEGYGFSNNYVRSVWKSINTLKPST